LKKYKVREYKDFMLKWKGFDKTFIVEHRWVLILWLQFIMFSMAYIALTPYGDLNIRLSNNYNKEVGFFFRYFTTFGEESILVPLGLILILIIRNTNFSIRLIFTFLLNSLMVIPVKYYIFGNQRPKLALHKYHLVFTEGVRVWEYNSFPSGHTSAAFAMAMALALWFKNVTISIIVVIMAMGVGLSRIYLQQHFIEDVLGGSVVGLLAALIASGFYWIPKTK